MSQIPENLRYTEDHEWIQYDADSGVATIGITDYAQGELGDVVFLELPAAGSSYAKGETCGTIEAVKTVADIFSPVAGEVVEANAALDDAPERVNADPYGDGWMIKLRVTDAGELDGLLDAGGYQEHIG